MSLWHWVKSKIWQNRFGQIVENTGATSAAAPRRTVHVVVMDGTLSLLEQGFETNAGLAYQLLKRGAGPGVILHYQPGLQFDRSNLLASAWSVVTGSGLDLQIQQVYGALASRYQPGDEIFLIGYSRGAFAARSLAGLIDRVGLLRRDQATQRHVAMAYRHYRQGGADLRVFADEYCHKDVPIAAIGVWDTVKALGLRLPVLWRLFEGKYKFHNHQISACVGAGFQALALDETRNTYRPEIWEESPDWSVLVQQVWFVGNHGDVGGQVMGSPQTRPLSNIPFVWMMQRLQEQGLPLPEAWTEGFVQDVHAPSTGNWSGLNWVFWARSRRLVGRYCSESIHPSVADLRPGRRMSLHDDACG